MSKLNDLVTLTNHVYYSQFQVPKLSMDTMKVADWCYALMVIHSNAATVEMTEFIGVAPNIGLSGMFVSYFYFEQFLWLTIICIIQMFQL